MIKRIKTSHKIRKKTKFGIVVPGSIEEARKLDRQNDNDIWYKASTKSNFDKYYTYICIYVDDILICSENPKSHMEKLGMAFLLKPEIVKEPDLYLGADVRKKESIDGKTIWITGFAIKKLHK